jgi:hypothetical protein
MAGVGAVCTHGATGVITAGVMTVAVGVTTAADDLAGELPLPSEITWMRVCASSCDSVNEDSSRNTASETYVLADINQSQTKHAPMPLWSSESVFAVIVIVRKSDETQTIRE